MFIFLFWIKRYPLHSTAYSFHNLYSVHETAHLIDLILTMISGFNSTTISIILKKKKIQIIKCFNLWESFSTNPIIWKIIKTEFSLTSNRNHQVKKNQKISYSFQVSLSNPLRIASGPVRVLCLRVYVACWQTLKL